LSSFVDNYDNKKYDQNMDDKGKKTYLSKEPKWPMPGQNNNNNNNNNNNHLNAKPWACVLHSSASWGGLDADSCEQVEFPFKKEKLAEWL